MQAIGYTETQRNNHLVYKKMRLVKDITNEGLTFRGIIDKFKNYTFVEHVDFIRNEFNCQSQCHIIYYLNITNRGIGMFFNRIISASLLIPNRQEVEFLSFPILTEGPNTEYVVNNILRNKQYDKICVEAEMEIKFLLSFSLDTLSEYEAEQIEDLYDEGDDEGYQDNQTPSPPIESPFVSDYCSICLTTKPDIIILPCLHQSICSQCEEAGKLTKCPTCREKIKIKIKI